MSKQEDGLSLFFYKDSNGTPVISIEWGDEAKNLFDGNGFSSIQMRVILNNHLQSSKTPMYIKTTLIKLIDELKNATTDVDKELRAFRKKQAVKQQLQRITKRANQ